MRIRIAKIEQLEEINHIYEYARSLMVKRGNPNQWAIYNHPNIDFIRNHILKGDLYTIGDDEILGVFILQREKEKTYHEIQGSWLNDEDYVTVHALAKKEGAKDIFSYAINYAKATSKNVRIDTHKDNYVMQHLIEKHGFSYCGVIHLLEEKSMDERLAYQFVGKEIDYSKYDLFIVDYDGTLISSMEMWSHMCSSFLLEQGFTLHEDVDKRTITQTNVETATYMRNHYFMDKTIPEMEDIMNAYVMKKYVTLPLKKNAIPTLLEMKKYGKVVLFSATSIPLLLASTKELEIYEYFDGIYSASALGVTKKDGSGYLHLLELLKHSKEKALIVEDAPHALAGAKMVHLETLGVLDTANARHWHTVYELSDFILR